MSNKVCVLEAIRAPRGKGRAGGALAKIAPVDLLSQLFNAMQQRTGLDTSLVEEVHLGCVTQVNDQGGNIAHTAMLYAGWEPRGSATTLTSFCTSGLTAASLSAARIQAGMGDIYVAGGVESMSRVPMLSDNGPLFVDPVVSAKVPFLPNGVIADAVATREGYSREQIDAYAVDSHRKAAAATREGRFARSLVPIRASDGSIALANDELIRAETSVESMAKLVPLFAEQGAKGPDQRLQADLSIAGPIRHDHHAGAAPGMVDGASLALLASEVGAKHLGIKPRAYLSAFSFKRGPAVEGLTGGIFAAEDLLAKTGLRSADIDLWEFNEGFAAIAMYFAQRLGVPLDRLNVNGGGIAMGHAMGATGVNLIGTMIDELERRKLHRGLVAISGAAGAGAAVLIERD